MSESFADLFEESLQQVEMTPGAIVVATVIAIENDFVVVFKMLKKGFALCSMRSIFFEVKMLNSKKKSRVAMFVRLELGRTLVFMKG